MLNFTKEQAQVIISSILGGSDFLTSQGVQVGFLDCESAGGLAPQLGETPLVSLISAELVGSGKNTPQFRISEEVKLVTSSEIFSNDSYIQENFVPGWVSIQEESVEKNEVVELDLISHLIRLKEAGVNFVFGHMVCPLESNVISLGVKEYAQRNGLSEFAVFCKLPQLFDIGPFLNVVDSFWSVEDVLKHYECLPQGVSHDPVFDNLCVLNFINLMLRISNS